MYNDIIKIRYNEDGTIKKENRIRRIVTERIYGKWYNYYEDYDGNRWDLSMGYRQANDCSHTLEDCANCYNCYNCTGCNDCDYSHDLFNCDSCRWCEYCENMCGCDECENCEKLYLCNNLKDIDPWHIEKFKDTLRLSKWTYWKYKIEIFLEKFKKEK